MPRLTRRRRGVLVSAVVCAALSVPAVLAQDLPSSNAVEADRVVVRFAAGEFEILAVNPTRKVLPPSDVPPVSESPLSGFWYELQSAEGDVLYRRIVGDPIRWVFEGPDLMEGPLDGAPMRAAMTRLQTRESQQPLPSSKRLRRGRRALLERERETTAAPQNQPLAARRIKRELASMLESDTVGPVVRDEVVPQERVFTLLIPRAGDGDELVIFSSPLEPGAMAEPAEEIARLPVLEPPQASAGQGGEEAGS